jgi:nucleotide-binding universal stress UspA family protein
MFSKILHANDGSDPAFRAFALALDISKQNTAALHLVCVEEIPYLPEYIEEVREETRVAARRFHSVLQKARGMAEQREVKLQTHLRAGHPVRAITDLANELGADLLVIGATGHSQLYERMIAMGKSKEMLSLCIHLFFKLRSSQSRYATLAAFFN